MMDKNLNVNATSPTTQDHNLKEWSAKGILLLNHWRTCCFL